MENTENKEVLTEENTEVKDTETAEEIVSETTEESSEKVSDENKDPKKKSSLFDDIADVFETILLCMLVFLLFRAYVVDQAIVDGPSMEPTLYTNERILYNKLYSPKDYDIVIVNNEKLGPLVKRVIATEGEEIDIKDGKVFVNGTELDEQVYDHENQVLDAKHFVSSITTVSYNPFIAPEDYPVTVPEGYFFVMGDNRIVSNDSRSRDVGFVKNSELVGKVIMRYSPLEDLEFFW